MEKVKEKTKAQVLLEKVAQASVLFKQKHKYEIASEDDEESEEGNSDSDWD